MGGGFRVFVGGKVIQNKIQGVGGIIFPFFGGGFWPRRVKTWEFDFDASQKGRDLAVQEGGGGGHAPKTGWLTAQKHEREPQDTTESGEEIDFVPGVWGEVAKLFDSWSELRACSLRGGGLFVLFFFFLFPPFSFGCWILTLLYRINMRVAKLDEARRSREEVWAVRA